MRIPIAAVLLLTMISPVCAKDWSAMSGRERRLQVMAYVETHNLQCKVPRGISSLREADRQLAMVPFWSVVAASLPLYCKKGPPKILVVKSQPEEPSPIQQVSTQESPIRIYVHPFPAAIAPDKAATDSQTASVGGSEEGR